MKLHSLTRGSSLAVALILALALCASGSAFAVSNPLVASGSVSYDGTLQTGTPNVTSSYNSSTGMYQIHMAGVCFVRTNYTTVATVSGYNGFPAGALFVNTDDDGNYCNTNGDLVIGLRDVNGNLQQADFQFIVIKK